MEGVQVFRKLYVNLLLKNLLLGTNLCFIRQHELIHRSNKVSFVYIASRKRIVLLFTFKQLSFFELFNDLTNSVDTISGKVSVRDLHNGLEGIGFVLDEDEYGNNLEVILEDGNKVIFPNSPRMNWGSTEGLLVITMMQKNMQSLSSIQ